MNIHDKYDAKNVKDLPFPLMTNNSNLLSCFARFHPVTWGAEVPLILKEKYCNKLYQILLPKTMGEKKTYGTHLSVPRNVDRDW